MLDAHQRAAAKIIKVNRPKRKDILIIRILIGLALTNMMLFIAWFANIDHIGYTPLYILLTFALFFKLLKMIHEWYHYWHVSIPEAPEWKTQWKVDILTTACPGEPYEMFDTTLRAMQKITYPHTSYLCDEGDDPQLKKLCDELGIIHVTRKIKVNAKAGNINNALQQASGDICVVLDPDHVPHPEFLHRVLPYFEDPEVGYVQCVQGYSNQEESLIARGAAEQTYHFYGPMMMCMNTYGTVQTIGANCTFRRAALDSIGGHAAGLSEDMHTAMQLHAKGWKSVYVPEMLTRGLVPATLSAYCKQQLKWSRGTFELLFRTYPKLYKNFTWRQKLHYGTLPMYFLFGLINFIDILIPILALCFAQVPWEVNLVHFSLFFLPVCGLNILIRIYAQRWLLEKHEVGMHLSGGILRLSTWWIFLIGFIYSIFNVNVPYIPTPKSDEHQNHLLLCLPNFIICLISISAVIYGLYIDWSPYSLAMACYALINTIMLMVIIVISQQKTLQQFQRKLSRVFLAFNPVKPIRAGVIQTKHVIYATIRNSIVVILLAASIVFFSYSSKEDEDIFGIIKHRETGGFYAGVNVSNVFEMEKHRNIELLLHRPMDIVAFELKWNPDSVINLNASLEAIALKNALPFLIWKLDPSISPDVFHNKLSNNQFIEQLEKIAGIFRKYKSPVFISFAPGKEKKAFSAEKYIYVWEYLYSYFNKRGISNLTWVWSTDEVTAFHYFPGPLVVDWIGISCKMDDLDYHDFDRFYQPFRKAFKSQDKPMAIMIENAGDKKCGDQLIGAFQKIKDNYREIQSVILPENANTLVSDNEKNPYSFKTLSDFFDELPFSESPVIRKETDFLKPRHDYVSKFSNGKVGQKEFYINGKPWYFKGVAYNTSHDWRDGHMPLTRRQLEKDFELIKAMGANTVRRYDYGIYDQNILNIADEKGLKVLYGFWFEQKLDYYKDSIRVEEYIKEVEEKVKKYKDHPAIIGWTLGNETWGLLKHKFNKPYLILVRRSYLKLIEHLAQRIHELDPDKPVFTCIEHEANQIAGELTAFHDEAPSLDALGINSYYKDQMVHVNKAAYQFDSLRPYFISEFGPTGYWLSQYNHNKAGELIEETDMEKAKWYKEQWKYYITVNKGFNIGAFAYCWHDRMEGSNTWFGLTDYKGRPKPTYYALQEVWANKKSEAMPAVTIETPAMISPGKEYVYRAIVNNDNEDLKYEWYLHKDEYLDRIKNIDYLDKGRSILMQAPKKRGKYRLYLYVSNSKGNVTTASVPVTIR